MLLKLVCRPKPSPAQRNLYLTSPNMGWNATPACHVPSHDAMDPLKSRSRVQTKSDASSNSPRKKKFDFDAEVAEPVEEDEVQIGVHLAPGFTSPGPTKRPRPASDVGFYLFIFFFLGSLLTIPIIPISLSTIIRCRRWRWN